jgi:L-iditol 2-dehydrogenase
MAKKFGAQVVINPKDGNLRGQVLAETEGLGPDVVVEAVGRTETFEQAIDLARRGGRILVFGFAPEGKKATVIPFNVLSRELTVLGSWVNPYTYSRALDILATGKLDVQSLISNRLKLDDIMQAYTMMMEKPAGFMKSVVFPQ